MENYLFEKMSVPKAYMKLALPVVLSMIVSLVYNMVDTYFIFYRPDRSAGTGRRSVTCSTDVYLNDRIWRYLRTWRKFRDFKIVRREER